MDDVNKVLKQMRGFTENVRSGKWKGVSFSLYAGT